MKRILSLLAVLTLFLGSSFAQIQQSGAVVTPSATQSILGGVNVAMTNSTCNVLTPGSACTLAGTSQSYLVSYYLTYNITSATSAQSLVIPLQPGAEHWVNNTSAFVITAGGSTGTTVAVQPGTDVLIHCPDGTNYVQSAVIGTGTNGTIPLWSGTSSLGNSPLSVANFPTTGGVFDSGTFYGQDVCWHYESGGTPTAACLRYAGHGTYHGPYNTDDGTTFTPTPFSVGQLQIGNPGATGATGQDQAPQVYFYQGDTGTSALGIAKIAMYQAQPTGACPDAGTPLALPVWGFAADETLSYCTNATSSVWTLFSNGSGGTVDSGTQYSIAQYTTTGTVIGQSNITTDSTGNNLTAPGNILAKIGPKVDLGAWGQNCGATITYDSGSNWYNGSGLDTAATAALALAQAGTTTSTSVAPTMQGFPGNGLQGEVQLASGGSCVVSTALHVPPGVAVDFNNSTVYQTTAGEPCVIVDYTSGTSPQGYGIFNNVIKNGRCIGLGVGTSTAAGISSSVANGLLVDNFSVSGFKYGLLGEQLQYSMIHNSWFTQNEIGCYLTIEPTAPTLPSIDNIFVGGSCGRNSKYGFWNQYGVHTVIYSVDLNFNGSVEGLIGGELIKYVSGYTVSAGGTGAGSGNVLSQVFIQDIGGGQTDGTYTVTAVGGGGTGATVQIVIAGGAITSAVVLNPGANYTSAPTFMAAAGGTPGTLTSTIGGLPVQFSGWTCDIMPRAYATQTAGAVTAIYSVAGGKNCTVVGTVSIPGVSGLSATPIITDDTGIGIVSGDSSSGASSSNVQFLSLKSEAEGQGNTPNTYNRPNYGYLFVVQDSSIRYITFRDVLAEIDNTGPGYSKFLLNQGFSTIVDNLIPSPQLLQPSPLATSEVCPIVDLQGQGVVAYWGRFGNPNYQGICGPNYVPDYSGPFSSFSGWDGGNIATNGVSTYGNNVSQQVLASYFVNANGVASSVPSFIINNEGDYFWGDGISSPTVGLGFTGPALLGFKSGSMDGRAFTLQAGFTGAPDFIRWIYAGSSPTNGLPAGAMCEVFYNDSGSGSGSSRVYNEVAQCSFYGSSPQMGTYQSVSIIGSEAFTLAPVIAATASPGTNTTQIATTAFVLANASAGGYSLGGTLSSSNFVLGVGAGVGASINQVEGTDGNHYIELTTGTSPLVSSILFTATFTASRGHNTFCLIQNSAAQIGHNNILVNVAGVSGGGTPSSTGYVAATTLTAPDASTLYQFSVSCP